jgi:hypothetical protein
MLKKTICLLFIISGLSACENEQKVLEKKLHNEIMAVHDEVMPKMGDVNVLKQSVQKYSDITKGEKAELKDSLIRGVLTLTEADEAMMEWMAKYDYPNPKLSQDETLKYLQAQKDSVKQMSDKIYMAIAIGHQLLKNAPDSLKPLKK